MWPSRRLGLRWQCWFSHSIAIKMVSCTEILTEGLSLTLKCSDSPYIYQKSVSHNLPWSHPASNWTCPWEISPCAIKNADSNSQIVDDSGVPCNQGLSMTMMMRIHERYAQRMMGAVVTDQLNYKLSVLEFFQRKQGRLTMQHFQ